MDIYAHSCTEGRTLVFHMTHTVCVPIWIYRFLQNMNADQIPEVWRMLHSLAGQLEYLHTVSTAMQELIQYELKCLAVVGPDGEAVE